MKKMTLAMLHGIVATAVMAQAAVAMADSSAPSLEISREVSVAKFPSGPIGNKALYVSGKPGAEALVATVKAGLRGRGYRIAEREEDAEAKVALDGVVHVGGKGLETVSARLNELAQSTPNPAAPDYQHQTVSLDHVALATAFTSALPVTDILTWLGQKTGLAGRFNEMLTGDPRGICIHENCNKYFFRVGTTISGDARISLLSSARHEKMMLDLLLAKTLQELVESFPIVEPDSGDAKAKPQEAGNS